MRAHAGREGGFEPDDKAARFVNVVRRQECQQLVLTLTFDAFRQLLPDEDAAGDRVVCKRERAEIGF